MIISAPGFSANSTSAQTEFVDIFPTLCDLAKLKIPANLDGLSLMPLMKNPTTTVKEFSVSQYPRSGKDPESERLGYASSKVMGYSLRTKKYRYTIWMKNDFRSTDHYDEKLIIGEELYDYEADPLETINVFNEAKYKSTGEELKNKMILFFKSQETK
jgi:arylsulfatase A-like enzyme